MNKKILIFIVVGIIVVVLGVGGYFFLIPRCPKSCDDGNSCTRDVCSKETNYKCSYLPIPNCCGNKTCETGENYEICPADCPNCDDNNKCTKDSFDYYGQKCVNSPILDTVCCGNTACEPGETYQSCARDCPNCDDNNKCTKDSYDYHKQTCLHEIIIPCCGNGICDKSAETRSNCSADCPSCDDNNKLTADSFNYTTQKCVNTVTHYFIENFESGTDGWSFSGDQGPTLTAWGTTAADGSAVLRGTGHNWANLDGKEWTNYIFKTKFKIILEGDGIHFNFRNKMGEGNSARYFIGVGKNHLNLAKQINEKFFDSLAQPKEFPILGDGWHTFEIRGYGNILNIYIDNNLLIKYKDIESPVLSGGIAFETLNNSEYLIDDVEIKIITEKDVIYP